MASACAEIITWAIAIALLYSPASSMTYTWVSAVRPQPDKLAHHVEGHHRKLPHSAASMRMEGAFQIAHGRCNCESLESDEKMHSRPRSTNSGCTCCSVVMSWIMVGAQAAALALLVCSRPFAWAPTVRRLWARQRVWRAVRNGGSRVPPPLTRL